MILAMLARRRAHAAARLRRHIVARAIAAAARPARRLWVSGVLANGLDKL